MLRADLAGRVLCILSSKPDAFPILNSCIRCLTLKLILIDVEAMLWFFQYGFAPKAVLKLTMRGWVWLLMVMACPVDLFASFAPCFAYSERLNGHRRRVLLHHVNSETIQCPWRSMMGDTQQWEYNLRTNITYFTLVISWLLCICLLKFQSESIFCY